jgi:hypothetical protein
MCSYLNTLIYKILINVEILNSLNALIYCPIALELIGFLHTLPQIIQYILRYTLHDLQS